MGFYKQRNKLSNESAKNIFCEENANIFETPENYDFKPSDDFGGFYTYNEMLNELDDMHSLYPEIISARSDIKDETFSSSPHIHETYEGRYLQWVKISDNPNVSYGEPQILYTALHHAREPASLQQLIYFMWYLLENYASNDSIKQIIDNSELFFVPCVNQDGYIFNETIEPSKMFSSFRSTRIIQFRYIFPFVTRPPTTMPFFPDENTSLISK